MAANYKDIRSQLAESKLALFELPGSFSAWEKGLGGWGGILRLLATAALLSLGAPFWFNTLKGLVNLRSQVAEPEKKT
jgi:hypothetical protein